VHATFNIQPVLKFFSSFYIQQQVFLKNDNLSKILVCVEMEEKIAIGRVLRIAQTKSKRAIHNCHHIFISIIISTLAFIKIIKFISYFLDNAAYSRLHMTCTLLGSIAFYS